VLPMLRRLFLGQVFSESSTEAPFEDYLALGQGKTPMLLTYEIPADGSARVLADILAAARDLEPSGNTAIYSALKAAYTLATRQTTERPGALTTVVLMTDGETNRGIEVADFRAYYRRLAPAARAVPTFPVKSRARTGGGHFSR
jgi:von Willebrand factor type A domain